MQDYDKAMELGDIIDHMPCESGSLQTKTCHYDFLATIDFFELYPEWFVQNLASKPVESSGLFFTIGVSAALFMGLAFSYRSQKAKKQSTDDFTKV